MADPLDYGLRQDGTKKGQGWLGPIKRPDGRVSTELTIGVSIGGKEVDIPSMVPTLTPDEVNYLITTPENPQIFQTPIGLGIMQKAADHAQQRLMQGLSPFKD
jgi:hypothetical protein